MQCLAGSSCVQVAGYHHPSIMQNLECAAGVWHDRLVLLWCCYQISHISDLDMPAAVEQ